MKKKNQDSGVTKVNWTCHETDQIMSNEHMIINPIHRGLYSLGHLSLLDEPSLKTKRLR
jgi:hypothetical protein